MSGPLDELLRVIEEEGDNPIAVINAVAEVADEVISGQETVRLDDYMGDKIVKHAPPSRVALALVVYIHQNATYLNSLECTSALARLIHSSSEVYYEKLPPQLARQQPKAPSFFHLMYLVYAKLMHGVFEEERDARAQTFQQDCARARFAFTVVDDAEGGSACSLSNLLTCSDDEFESFVTDVAGAHMDIDYASDEFKRVILGMEFALAERVFHMGTMTPFHVVDMCAVRLMCMRMENIERTGLLHTVRDVLVRRLPEESEMASAAKFLDNVVKQKELSQIHLTQLYALVSRRMIPVGQSLLYVRGMGSRATTSKIMAIGSLSLDELNSRQMYAFGTTEVKEIGVFYRSYKRWGLCSLFTLLYVLQALLANSLSNLLELLCTDTPDELERQGICTVSPITRFIVQVDRFFVIHGGELVDTEQDALAAITLLMRSVRENGWNLFGVNVSDIVGEFWTG